MSQFEAEYAVENSALSSLAESTRPILIVDDDGDARSMLRGILKPQGYPILEASSGEEGLHLALHKPPLLVLLDGHLPDMRGLDVLRRLRADRTTSDVVVIMVTCLNSVEDRLKGYRATADGYIGKPFVPDELLAHIAAVLRRHHDDRSLDPLTSLPGNLRLRQELTTRIASGVDFSALYADLSHFKPYVDRYGLEAASRVLENLTEILMASVTRFGAAEDFLGHIGGDDFLILTSPSRAAPVGQYVVSEFEKRAPNFYNAVDRARGYFDGSDRFAVRRRFPLVGADVAAVDVAGGQFDSTDEFGRYLAQCKSLTKRSGRHWCRFEPRDRARMLS